MTTHRLNHHDILVIERAKARARAQQRAKRRADFLVAAASVMALLSLLAMAVSGSLA